MERANGSDLNHRVRKARIGAQFFRKWVESRVGERLNDPQICRPSMVCTILTSKCNYKCSFCNHPKMTQVDQMPREKWEEILLQLKDWLGIYRINFLGGEPFLYPELFDLLAFCKQHGIMAGITTNGWFLTKENCQELAKHDLFNISLSVDGYGPEMHDRLRGIPGAHKRLWEGIENLREYVIGHNGNHTRVAFRTNVLAEVKDIKRKGFPILNSQTHLDAIGDYYHNPSLIYEIKRECKTAWEQMVILPDGYVRSCTELPPYGNLFENTPREIWESEEAQRHREGVAQCRRTCLNMFHWKRSLPEKVEMFSKFF